MINIAKLLKDAPKGMKLYSLLFGECKLGHIEDEMFIHVSTNCTDDFKFDEFGQLASLPIGDNANGECLLFPSKDCRTWEGWKVPKPHYNIANFHAGMSVLVRDSDEHKWLYTIFGIYNKDNLLYPFVVVNMRGYEQCIPFNDDTRHLLGTTDMPSEEYINW